MQRHLNVKPGDLKKEENGGGVRWRERNIRGKEKKEANRVGRETNVRAVVHEIKRYFRNTPACYALW